MRTFQGRDFTAYFHGPVTITLGDSSGSVLVASAHGDVVICLKGGNVLECPGDGPNDGPIITRDELGRIL